MQQRNKTYTSFLFWKIIC